MTCPEWQTEYRRPVFLPVGTPSAGNASQGGSREGRDRCGVREIHQQPEGGGGDCQSYEESARGTQLDVYDVRFRRLEAEIWLNEEKAR